MKHKPLFYSLIVICVAAVGACIGKENISITGNGDESELLAEEYPDPVYADNGKMRAIWGNTDTRYDKTVRTVDYCNAFRFKAWKNEKVAAEAVLWAFEDLTGVGFKVSDLTTASGDVIPSSCITVNFVAYVIADTYNRSGGDCALRDKGVWPAVEIADRLDDDRPVNIARKNCQPVWVSVKVPKDAPTGVYKGKATVTADDMDPLELPIMLKVGSHVLPDPSDWAFQLDIWQHFEEVATYTGIPLWSDDYFTYMRPLMKMLADAGQKCIYTNLSGAPSMTMVSKIKDMKDNSWTYDYTVFDKWVELMMEVGITSQIDCYGLVPWAYKFEWQDKRGNKYYGNFEPGTKEYEEYWTPFFKDFAQHLRDKGWFDRTYIAFDERTESELLKSIPVVKAAVPEFKIKHTGFYYESIDPVADDIVVVYLADEYPDGVVKKRRSEGKKSLYYTACGQAYPNQFLYNPVAENVWKCWAAMAMNLDGYLQWAFNKWGENPVYDTRAIAAPAGDRFIVYPDHRSSVRFEKTIEGIQDFEKARILLREWKSEGNSDRIARLEEALARFNRDEIPLNGAESSVYQAKEALE